MPKDPQRDPNSIGRILITYGLTPVQLSEALRFKKENGDIFIGEACVRLGYVSRETLETAIRKQSASKKNAAVNLIQLATERTRRVSAQVTTLAAISFEVAEKLAK